MQAWYFRPTERLDLEKGKDLGWDLCFPACY